MLVSTAIRTITLQPRPLPVLVVCNTISGSVGNYIKGDAFTALRSRNVDVWVLDMQQIELRLIDLGYCAVGRCSRILLPLPTYGIVNY
jgi:hypothetical protein